jgi:hypothetical protein
MTAIRSCIEMSILISDNMSLIVEEYISGHEIDIDIILQNNKVKFISISDNTPPIEPYFFEKGNQT